MILDGVVSPRKSFTIFFRGVGLISIPGERMNYIPITEIIRMNENEIPEALKPCL